MSQDSNPKSGRRTRGLGKPNAAQAPAEASSPARRLTRAETLVGLMRVEGGASAADLAAAVGWQVHSVRGFIAGALKKRTNLAVTATKLGGVTRYSVADAAAGAQ